MASLVASITDEEMADSYEYCHESEKSLLLLIRSLCARIHRNCRSRYRVFTKNGLRCNEGAGPLVGRRRVVNLNRQICLSITRLANVGERSLHGLDMVIIKNSCIVFNFPTSIPSPAIYCIKAIKRL